MERPRAGLSFSSFGPRLIAVPVEGLLDVFHCSCGELVLRHGVTDWKEDT